MSDDKLKTSWRPVQGLAGVLTRKPQTGVSLGAGSSERVVEAVKALRIKIDAAPVPRSSKTTK